MKAYSVELSPLSTLINSESLSYLEIAKRYFITQKMRFIQTCQETHSLT